MDSDFKKRLSRIPKFDENMLKAFENRKLVFFIGAGVSRIMGVPGWSDFSARLIKKAFPSYKEYSTILKEITDSKERITIAYNQFHSRGKHHWDVLHIPWVRDDLHLALWGRVHQWRK